MEQKKGQIIEVITENECEHTCEMLCIGISEDNSCRFRCRKRFCEGKQVETDGNLFIAAQLTLILAAVVSLMLIISRSLASRYSRKERLL